MSIPEHRAEPDIELTPKQGGHVAAGYSGTPLAKKLGIKEGTSVFLVDAPQGFPRLLEPLPEGVQFLSRLSESPDIVHVFSTRKNELAAALIGLRKALKPTGAVWVSWPKKSAKVPTDITEDTIREVAFVDVKVCAIDEVWSGLKLVIRKELR